MTSKNNILTFFLYGFLSILFTLFLGTYWDALTSNPWAVRWWVDPYDPIHSYFGRTRWIVGEGILFVDIKSEYPLLATLLFSIARALSEAFPFGLDPSRDFLITWAGLSFFCYLLGVRTSIQAIGVRQSLFWLIPTTLYFTLYRFDFFPAFLTFLGLIALKEKKIPLGSLLFGGAIALKVYPLFFLPIYFVYLYRNHSISFCVKQVFLCLAPALLCAFAVWTWAGWEGAKMPYVWHSARGWNGESTYDSLVYFFKIFFGEYRAKRTLHHWFGRQIVGNILQILLILAVVRLQPKTLEELATSFLIVCVGASSLLVFYSPQFALWSIPFFCFIRNQKLYVLGILFLIWTYFYFPFGSDRWGLSNWRYQWILIGHTALRIAIVWMGFKMLLKGFKKRKFAWI